MQIDRDIFRELGSLQLATPGVATGRRAGDRRSPYRGRGLEFADYRAYSPGDDLRLVDWNIYSRLQAVLVRLFHEDRNLSVQIHVDASASMGFGAPRKLDHAGTLAAGIALLGLMSRDAVALGCSAHGRPLITVKGENQKALPRLLKMLERVEPEGAVRPWRDLRALRRGARADRFFFLSDMLYEPGECEQILRVLAGLSRGAVLIHTLSEVELAPRLDAPLQVVDAETGEEIMIQGGLSAQRRYAQGLAAWLERLEARCLALGVRYVAAHTDVSVRDLLHGVMRHRRVTASRTGDRA